MSYAKSPPPVVMKTTGGASGYVNVAPPTASNVAARYRCSDGILRELATADDIDVDTTCTFEDANHAGGVTTAVAAYTYYYVYLIPDDANNNILVAIADTQDPAAGGPGETGYDGTPWYYCGAFRTGSSSNPFSFKQYNGRLLIGEDDWNSFDYYTSDPGNALNEWVQISNLHAIESGRNFSAVPMTATRMFLSTACEKDNTWNFALKTYPITPTSALDTPTRSQGFYLDHSTHQWMEVDSSVYNVRMNRYFDMVVHPDNPKLYGWFWKQDSMKIDFVTHGWIDGYVGVQ